MRTEILRLNSALEGELLHGERVFPVLNALPGEIVEYELLGRGRRRRVRVHHQEPGSTQTLTRQPPFCPCFGRCGGCRGQHIAYPEQFSRKAAPYVEQMKSEFGLDVLLLPAASDRRYRNRMDFVVGVDVVGLRPAGSFRGYVDVPSCGIQRERADAVLGLTRELLVLFPGAAHHRKSGQGALKYLTVREGKASGAVILTLCEGREDVSEYRRFADALREALMRYERDSHYRFSLIECSARPLSEISAVPGGHALYGDLFFEEAMGPLSFRVPYDAFFQPNPPGFFSLYERALSFVIQQGLWRAGPVLDLYCGSAVLSLLATEMLATHQPGKELQSVEGIFGADFSPSGIELGVRNIESYQKERGLAFPFRLEARDLSRGDMDFPAASLAILDPPRAGLAGGVIRWMNEARPARVLLSIACSPLAQVENLKALAPGYRPIFSALTDPFPQTVHMESAVVLIQHDP